MGAIQVCFYHFIVLRLHAKSDLHAVAQMLLIQGTMSAISAGMLIYAGTVEMIAGDFVFGDVDGGHGHGHGHLPHSDPHHRPGSSHLHNLDEGKQLQEHLRIEATTKKKALAVLSLFAGVAGMVIIG
jgi:solute carrier family 39 (zinc transporter), member 1/2/3